jgi:hypothetical protein
MKRVLTRLRREPLLWAPFICAGLVVALADLIRTRDSIPVTTPEWVGRTLSVQYSFFPSGAVRTVRELGAFVDLRTPYMLSALALECAVFLAVGLAGWITITRALGAARQLGPVSRYLGVFGVIGLIPRVFGTTSVTLDSLPLTLLALTLLSFVSVRLFLVPGFIASGDAARVALERSVRASQGMFWSLLALVIIFGLGYWVLALVPRVGGLLSTGIVGPVHAVTLALLVEQRGTR